MIKRVSFVKGFMGSVAMAAMMAGCGGGSGSDYDAPSDTSTELYGLQPQEGPKSYLFFGEVNHKSLGSLKTASVIDPDDPGRSLIDRETGDVRYPVLSTAMDYNVSSGTYRNLHIDKLHYVSGGKAYVVPMVKDGGSPREISYAKTGTLSDASYVKIDYLGSKEYLVAFDEDANATILIPPEMSEDADPVRLGDRKLLTVTYPEYGEAVDGYLVYDNDTKRLQKCSLDMETCIDIMAAGSRDFLGDIGGTVYSALLSDGKLYRVDKTDGSTREIDLNGKEIAIGHGTTKFHGGSFYFIATDANLYRIDLMTAESYRLTPSDDETLERIRGFTDTYVIYGSDTILKAAKKDGTSTAPTVLAETTLTTGYKYVTNYGVGDDFLFVPYTIDPVSGNTSYKACIFNDGTIECRNDSFWAGVTIKTSGTRDFRSGFTYTPYAYIRIDDTDSYGGGTLKAIDPEHPFAEGIAMGTVPRYNFQTFLSNSRYLDEMIDSDGGVVFYAKNDTNFHVDAFYFNLLKKGSLVQLTDEDPFPDVNHGRDHCHGRVCMICHNLAGGKIYTDLTGKKSAYGYRVRLDFEDGTQVLADVAKGKGENFSLPLTRIKGNFKANVLDANGTVVNHSINYYHEGRKAANCNFCHGRYGQTRYEAPGSISIVKQ